MLLKERYTNALSFALLAFQSSLVKVPDNKTAPQLTGRRTDLNTLVVYRVRWAVSSFERRSVVISLLRMTCAILTTR